MREAVQAWSSLAMTAAVLRAAWAEIVWLRREVRR